MDTIRALAVDIGPRQSCSEEERRAAEWCATTLTNLGYDVSVEDFPSRPSYYSWFAAYLTLSLIGAVVAVPLPAAGVVLGLAGLILYARDSDGRPLLRPRTATSRNVVATPRTSGAPEAIVVAHMDSARSSPSFHPKMIGNFHASVVAVNMALAAVPLVAVAAWFAGDDVPSTMWIPAALLAAYLAFAVALMLYGQLRMAVVPGANDNASGVAVLMRLAAMDWNDKVWFLVTGSEEVGMLGAQAFLDRHAEVVSEARFLNIDNVGSGRLLALTGEGVLRERRPDRFMIDQAALAGAQPEPFKGLPTDATVMQARRLPAVTLLAVGENNVPANWHWHTDTIDNIDPGALDRATAVARTVLDAVVLQGSPR